MKNTLTGDEVHCHVYDVDCIRHVVQSQPETQDSLVELVKGLPHYHHETVVENEAADHKQPPKNVGRRGGGGKIN